MENVKYIIESLLFVAEGPLTIDDMKKALFHAETDEIREALNQLREDYEIRKGGFHLNEVAGGYQLRTRTEYNEFIKRLLQTKPLRMSKAALETLAIIAYKQPIIRSDIEHIRGVDSGGILRMLLDRKLIRILGRRTIPGRPLIYSTTKLFLEVFDLKDLKELPTPKEIEALEDETINSGDIPKGYTADPNQRQLFESEETPGIKDIEDDESQEIPGDVNPVDIQTGEEPQPSEDEADTDIDEYENTDFAQANEDENQYPEDLEIEAEEDDIDLDEDEKDLTFEPDEYDETSDEDEEDEDDDEEYLEP